MFAELFFAAEQMAAQQPAIVEFVDEVEHGLHDDLAAAILDATVE